MTEPLVELLLQPTPLAALDALITALLAVVVPPTLEHIVRRVLAVMVSIVAEHWRRPSASRLLAPTCGVVRAPRNRRQRQ